MLTLDALRAARDETHGTTGHRLALLSAEFRRQLGEQAVAAELQSPGGSLADRQRQLRHITSAYVQRRKTLDFGIALVEGTNWVVLTALTAGAARSVPRGAGGRGVLNGVKTVATLGLSKVEEMMKEAARVELRRNLKYNLDQYAREQPDLLPTLLATNDPAAFRAELENRLGPVFGSELDALPREEQELVNKFYIREVASALTDGIDALGQVQTLQAEDIAQNQKNIAGLARTFAAFAKDTNTQLTTLVATSTELREDISALDARVGRTEDGVAFLQRYAFGRMTPEEQIAALQADQVPGLSDEERDTLLQKAEALATRQRLSQKLGDFIGGAGNLVRIADALGVPGEILGAAQEAVEFASQASTAIQAFAGGDVLGGLAAVAGIFGAGGPDVATERHNEVMGALQSLYAQGEAISETLEDLRQGQQRIIHAQELTLQALDFLTEDVARNHAEAMTTLGRIEEDGLYNRRLILERIDREYRLAEQFLVDPDTNRIVLNTEEGHYPTNEQLRSIFDFLGGDSFKAAADRLRDVWEFHNRFHPWFLLQSYYKPEEPDEFGIRAFHTRLYAPQLGLLLSVIPAEERSTVLSGLLAPVQSAAAVRMKRSVLQDMWTSERYENSFQALMEEPLSPYAVEAHCRLLLDFHVLYQLYDPDEDRLHTLDELARDAPVHVGGRVGLRRAMALLDIAIAQQAMLGGEVLLLEAEKIVHGVPPGFDAANITPRPEEERFRQLVEIMGRNQMLAQNVLRFTLAEDVQQTSSFTAYGIALQGADAEALKLTFSGPWPVRWNNTVVLDGEGGVREPRGWVVDFGESVRPLPTVAELSRGLLLFPAALDELVRLRARVVDELSDYLVPASLGPEDREGFNRFLLATSGVPSPG